MNNAIIKENLDLEVGYEKTCDCKNNHLNCLTAKEWIKHQLGVWQFYYEKRDIRDKNIHPATFPLSLASKCIQLFTHEGELVVDPFVGSGTTMLSAQDLNRNSIGFDLKKEYVDFSNQRVANGNLLNNSNQIAFHDDARNINKYIKEESISLILTSPPYANLLNRKRTNKSRRNRKNEQYLKIEQYSQDPRDLGTLDINDFEVEIKSIFSDLLPLLKPKGHCVINVPDMWYDNQRITIHVSVINAMRAAGYELRNTIIWDRTNIVNGIGIFGWPSNYITMGTTFEYLLDFWRPEK
ncbi:DNA methyltransferase [Bacillus kwashiorkori]|uniref:DNA methyltransferase n=1 Tax=Bacillus kwashiorkori TaxID=1522318 RepID=UPI00078349BD|nr:DNA methyltransferase [Bacillus kwashiorkori]